MKKGIHNGFSGDSAPAIPRAPRSIRKSNKKIIDVSAFDLLATVAGKLLQESECSSASSNATAVNNQPAYGIDLIKREPECICQQNCDEYFFKTGHASKDSDHRYMSEKFPPAKVDAGLECLSVSTKPNHPENVNTDLKLANGRNMINIEKANKVPNVPLEQQGDSHDSNIEIGRHPGINGETRRDVIEKKSNTCNSTPVEGSFGRRNVELPLLNNSILDSYSRLRNDVNFSSKDDDDNCSQYYKPGTKVKAFRPVPRIGDRIVKKLLKSKHWKVTPNLKNCNVSDTDETVRSILHKRKACYARSENYAKRKFLDQSSVVTTDDRSSEEERLANSCELDMCGDESGSTAALKGVKVSIKSFRIPELHIQVPETATVGLLKRTVMEAVTRMLEGGFCVGVLFRGKKIRDDNSTLLENGILNSSDSLDALGFSLEPISATQTPLSASPQDPSLSLPLDTPQPINRSSCIQIQDPDPPSLGNTVKENTPIMASKALVAVEPMSMEPLPLITPMSRRCRRSEFTPRRARRPFSVSEVEALVEAVEELGTGRWRDVKLRSFDNAYHRTYVDLKDKWKTLVHTAKISPQQRRGEAVPQDVLDRVLGAHAQWSQQCNNKHPKIMPQTQTKTIMAST